MLIQVLYNNDHYDYVKDFLINDLIVSKKIVKFRRGTGWVTIGVDRIRMGSYRDTFNGNEKRAMNSFVNLRN